MEEKQELFNLLNQHNFTKEELKLITSIATYIWTQDYDLIEPLVTEFYNPKDLLDVYTDYDIDTDGSYYRRDKREVKMYCSEYENINSIFEYYNKKINNKTYYIIGNVFYFTYNNIKYWKSLSDFLDEENYVNDIIKALKETGAQDVVYKYGRLD